MAWWNRRQVPLYVAGIVLGAVVGLAAPCVGPALGAWITPVLALLIFATFVGVPLTQIGRSFRDLRFLGTALVLNFVVAPAVVYALSRFVADDRGLLLGLLLVLLTPCVDYVIVFTGLAGGAKAQLLAATPLLMLLQIVLLPLYVMLFAGAGAAQLIEVGPFVEAFLVLIAAPLVAAALMQAVARRARAGNRVEALSAAAMVPLMMLTLAVVVGSQVAAVGSQASTLLRVVPLYVAFLVVMLVIGIAAGRVGRLDVPATRAVVFSGSTRNSLVVLPLALALPATLGIAPLAVVTQTLVELVGMVVFVRLVPRLVPRRAAVDPAAVVPAETGPAAVTLAETGPAAATLERITPALAARIVGRQEQPGDRWHPEYPFADELDPLRSLAAATAATTDHGEPDPVFTMYLVRRTLDGLAVGGIGFFGPPDETGQVELGYGLVASARGAGLATEAVRAALGLAAVAGARRVVASTDVGNTASQRVLLKAGFTASSRDSSEVCFERDLSPADG